MNGLTAKAVLRRNYLFRGLPEAAIEQIAALAARRAFPKGAVVFVQGDEGDALYGVVSGQVRISTSTADGREVFLNIMEPGDTFGEIAIMDGLPRTATATAMNDAVLVVIQRAPFVDLLQREPGLAIHLLELLCGRIRWTSELLEDAAFLDGPARLAKRLLSLATLHGRPSGSGAELQITQEELAQFLWLSRQVVSQHLQTWRRAGWIELVRGRITVRDIRALERVVASEAGTVTD